MRIRYLKKLGYPPSYHRLYLPCAETASTRSKPASPVAGLEAYIPLHAVVAGNRIQGIKVQ